MRNNISFGSKKLHWQDVYKDRKKYQNINPLKFQVLLCCLVNIFHISKNKHCSEFSPGFWDTNYIAALEDCHVNLKTNTVQIAHISCQLLCSRIFPHLLFWFYERLFSFKMAGSPHSFFTAHSETCHLILICTRFVFWLNLINNYIL